MRIAAALIGFGFCIALVFSAGFAAGAYWARRPRAVPDIMLLYQNRILRRRLRHKAGAEDN